MSDELLKKNKIVSKNFKEFSMIFFCSIGCSHSEVRPPAQMNLPAPQCASQQSLPMSLTDLEPACRLIKSIPTSSTGFPKIIWTFWDKGAKKMSAFSKYNIYKWRQIAGAEGWQVIVVSSDASDECFYKKFIKTEDLPNNFEMIQNYIADIDKTSLGVVQSDHIRLALLYEYGGIWLDSSVVLLKPPSKLPAAALAGNFINKELAGYVNQFQGSKKFNNLNGFENWFIAARKKSKIIYAWKRIFTEYWQTKIKGQDIRKHPLYTTHDLSFIPENLRNYLSQHAAFSLAFERNPDFEDLMITRSIDGPFGFIKLFSFDAQEIYMAISQPWLFEKSQKMVEEVSPDFFKFTSDTLPILKQYFNETDMYFRCKNVFEYLYNDIADI